METRAHHVLIGLFTLLLVLCGAGFALWLSSGADSDFKAYQVVFNEPVKGLSQGSEVQYSGIRVGDVTALRLDPEDPNRVLARIRVARETPVHEDTQARLSHAGITGGSLIQLSGGSPQSPELRARRGEALPLIVATPSPLSQLLSGGEGLMASISQALDGLNRILSEDNARRIGQTLDNLQQATAVIAAQRNQIDAAMQQLVVVGDRAGRTLESSSRLLDNVNGLLDQQGREILVGADRAMDNLARSSERLERLLGDNEGALENGLQSFNELGPALNDLRGTLAALRSATQRLNEDPLRYLLGHERSQEFRP